MNNKLPIGVFDSGIGGLTVLDELIEKMPYEDYIYIGDQDYCPYGTKTNEEIKTRCKKIVNYLVKQNVKAIVIACNTASTHLEYLKQYTTIPLIGVIEPTCDVAIHQSKNHKIGIIGTLSTVKNAKYQNYLKRQNMQVFSLACSEFVDLVENNVTDEIIIQNIVNNKLSELKNKNIDTLIYGCTHFSLLHDNIKKVLGKLNYISCGYPTAIKLYECLNNENKLNGNNKKGVVHIYTTGDVEKTNQITKWFKKDHEAIQKIKLED